ncbi:hypothetical protein [Flavobacterium psychrotolerans]|uniref:Uncharacterized protein n=1 Tax=Flavobacterium psychrotolerans TaxID=2169410 RepID=A0A2U1JQQ3_9FLAO|nr:hypothetical protein [Flavobacterium psychrotolerans]PWA07158.1 hypothetical protein DB895_00050 [Flavobacterium psychrotolerans]
MKKTFLAFIIGFSYCLTSCTLTENIYINDNGSGKFSVEMDGSGLMAMMPKDSLKGEKSVDSIFSFKKIFIERKDSIAKLSQKEQDVLKKLENFNMRMKMDLVANQLLFFMNTDFKSVAELQDIMATMNTYNSFQNTIKSKTEANSYIPSSGFGSNNSVLSYSYDSKKFIRKATLIPTNKVLKDSTQNFKMVFDASNYILKYHFPKPVKKVSNANASFSEDRKTVTIQYPFNVYMENPDKLNLEVEF